jgi:probable HAF family extracellular repeat protein
MFHLRLCRLLVVSMLELSLMVSPSWAQVAPSFRGLGQFASGIQSSFAYDVSGDGSIVVGDLWLNNGEHHAFRWGAAEGVQLLPNDAVAEAASFDGSVIVGQAYWPDTDSQAAFRWTAGEGMQRLPLLDAHDVSADGNVVVAFALRWTAPGTVENLGGGHVLSAEGVSAEGQVVVGWFVTDIVDRFGNQVHAFRWTPATGIKDLGTLRDGTESIAEGISANGSVVVGQARDKDMFWHAFRWTATTGMQDLRTLGGTMSAASATSADGSVIVGRSLITSALGSERAFRWTTKNQMQDLRRELLNAGVTAVQNWVLITATSVSADGTVIVGYGRNPNKQWEAFRAVLPVPR